MICGESKEKLRQYFEDLAERAKAKGYSSASEEFRKGAELIPAEGCLTPELDERVSAHLERGTELLSKGERKGGDEWILGGLAGLLGLGLGIWLLSQVNKLGSFEVGCPSCGGAVSWPAGLRRGYCPYCKSLLEYG